MNSIENFLVSQIKLEFFFVSAQSQCALQFETRCSYRGGEEEEEELESPGGARLRERHGKEG